MGERRGSVKAMNELDRVWEKETSHISCRQSLGNLTLYKRKFLRILLKIFKELASNYTENSLKFALKPHNRLNVKN